MSKSFNLVKGYIIELGYPITFENEKDGVIVINEETEGIQKLVIGCADPILIMEQYIFEIKNESINIFKSLLQKNRDIVHGAFVLDETGTKVIFRDTLQIDNLDKNELEGSIHSLSLMLSEFSDKIITFSKQ